MAADCCLLGKMDISNIKTNEFSGPHYHMDYSKDYISQRDDIFLMAYIQTYLSQNGIQTINLIKYDESSLYRLVSKGLRVVVFLGQYGDVQYHNIVKFIRKYNPKIKIVFCNSLGLGIQELSTMNIDANFDHCIKTPYFLPALAECILSVLQNRSISKMSDNETDIVVTPMEQDFINKHCIGEINWYPFKTKLTEMSLLKPHIYSNYILKASDFYDFLINNTLNILYFGNTKTILYKEIFLKGTSNIYYIFQRLNKLKSDFSWMSFISIHDITEIDAEMLAFWKCRALFITLNEDDLELLESIKSSILYLQKVSIMIYVILNFKADEKTRALISSVSANIV